MSSTYVYIIYTIIVYVTFHGNLCIYDPKVKIGIFADFAAFFYVASIEE